MQRDPNGIAAAVVLLVGIVAGVLHLTPAPVDVQTAADGIAALIMFGSIIAARRVTWAPATVAALTPADIPAGNTLPTTVAGVALSTSTPFGGPAGADVHADPPPAPPATSEGRVF